MKHLFVIAVLLGACAPEVPMMAETSGGEAGSVAEKSEALLVACSSASICNAQKAFVDSASGTHWTWSSSPCGTSVPPWHGMAPGGRIGQSFLVDTENINARQFNLSQQWNAIVHCTCPTSEHPSCHF